ncbi:MAG: hypothetical protein Q8L26_08665 [Candidatus Omnitrophota bacterium]|nr:hypothetical protein [Candidatus Omnitrophota bacterium]
MNKQILLVEPGYENPYPSLALMKISTWHKNKGDEVDYIKDNAPQDYFGYQPPKLKEQYDIIYITTLFTYHFQAAIKSIKDYQSRYPNAEVKVGGILATLLPDLIKRETGIIPHVGLFDKVEGCSPDYSFLPSFPFSITYTTRGCIRKCKFCVVRLLEPKFFVRKNWEKDINPNSKKIIFWDNNWLASPNFYKDIEKLKKIGKPFDFNQGIDCRLFDEEKAKILSQTKIDPLRFAFDNPSQEGYIQNAIKLAKKYSGKDIMVYVIFNSEEAYDTPEFFYHRINELNKLGVDIFPMRYRPINSIQKHIISPQWNSILLRGIKLITTFYYSRGVIRKNRKVFLKMFGKNADEFKRGMHKVYKYDKKLNNKKSTASL